MNDYCPPSVRVCEGIFVQPAVLGYTRSALMTPTFTLYTLFAWYLPPGVSAKNVYNSVEDFLTTISVEPIILAHLPFCEFCMWCHDRGTMSVLSMRMDTVPHYRVAYMRIFSSWNIQRTF